MAKITLAELQAKLGDINVPDEEIAAYLTGKPDDAIPFGPALMPDPAKVSTESALEELQTEAAVASGMMNAFDRLRRRKRFEARLGKEDLPIVYAEGDSWFQFPFLIKDIVDHLQATHLVWCTSKAGDTLQNMVFQKPEYLNELTKLFDRGLKVQTFLFSGAGNDVVGKGPDGDAALSRIVRPYNAGRSVAWHIETDGLSDTLAFIGKAYRHVLDQLEAAFPTQHFRDLKVVIHGYDYSPTRGVPNGDPDRPSYARDWTGEPLSALGFPNNEIAGKVVVALIDRLNDMTKTVCDAYPRAVHADLRKSVPQGKWADELHPTDAGFASATAKLRTFL